VFLTPGTLLANFPFEPTTFKYSAPLDWSKSSFDGRAQPKQAAAPIDLSLPIDFGPARPLRSGSRFESLLREGEFVVTCEVLPPPSSNVAHFLNTVQTLEGQADAVQVLDNAGANLQLSGVIAAYLIEKNGIETLLQMTCRDRNRSQLQADLLGACGLGVKNVVCLTGEHPTAGDHPEVKPVFDLAQVQLIQVIKHLRDEGKFMSGRELYASPKVLIGGVVAPIAPPRDYRLHDLGRKAAAGADFAMTNAIFDIDMLRDFFQAVVENGLDHKVNVLVSVGVLSDLEGALAIDSSVAGVSVPDKLIQRLKAAPADQQKQIGFEIAVETIQQLREMPGVAGINFKPTLSDTPLSEIAELCAAAGLTPRPTPAPVSDSPTDSPNGGL
jgi:methylenetetrahydrofolate reductase (NADPH)